MRCTVAWHLSYAALSHGGPVGLHASHHRHRTRNSQSGPLSVFAETALCSQGMRSLCTAASRSWETGRSGTRCSCRRWRRRAGSATSQSRARLSPSHTGAPPAFSSLRSCLHTQNAHHDAGSSAAGSLSCVRASLCIAYRVQSVAQVLHLGLVGRGARRRLLPRGGRRSAPLAARATADARRLVGSAPKHLRCAACKRGRTPIRHPARSASPPPSFRHRCNIVHSSSRSGAAHNPRLNISMQGSGRAS